MPLDGFEKQFNCNWFKPSCEKLDWAEFNMY